jgi:hypothetical protein
VRFDLNIIMCGCVYLSFETIVVFGGFVKRARGSVKCFKRLSSKVVLEAAVQMSSWT